MKEKYLTNSYDTDNLIFLELVTKFLRSPSTHLMLMQVKSVYFVKVRCENDRNSHWYRFLLCSLILFNSRRNVLLDFTNFRGHGYFFTIDIVIRHCDDTDNVNRPWGAADSTTKPINKKFVV